VDSSERILVLLLVNEHPASCENYCQQNQQTLHELIKGGARSLASSPPIWLATGKGPTDLIIIDRTLRWRFPDKQGVGLARKIIADVGLSLWYAKKLRRKWLHNTDGDAYLPCDYFLQAEAHKNDPHCKALLYQYQHIPDNKTNDQDLHWQAAQQYEIWLRYYEMGLAYAGSPYAFPTIGSTITMDAESYQSVHGFPRRSAGEDFYMLNKLAKTGKVQVLGGNPILLTDRPSMRVPFGTGQGTAKIQNLIQNREQFNVYHPSVFHGLKVVLQTALESLQTAQVRDFCEILRKQTAIHAPSLLDDSCQELWLEAVRKFGFIQACSTASKQARDQEGIRRQFHVWFDGFRTLKWIHLLRDQFFGSLELKLALANAEFIPPNYRGDLLQHLRLMQTTARCGGLH